MEKLIVEEICKNLKWKDKIIIRTFKGTFIRIYNDIRVTIFNKIIE